MAINLTKDTRYGVSVTHWVMDRYDVSRDNSGIVTCYFNGYKDASSYNNGKSPLVTAQLTIKFEDLLSTTKQKMLELKGLFEDVIASMADYNGTRVNDDGSSVS